MSRDPSAYPDPEVFLPERFMDNGSPIAAAQDPSRLQFGFGRRCVTGGSCLPCDKRSPRTGFAAECVPAATSPRTRCSYSSRRSSTSSTFSPLSARAADRRKSSGRSTLTAPFREWRACGAVVLAASDDAALGSRDHSHARSRLVPQGQRRLSGRQV